MQRYVKIKVGEFWLLGFGPVKVDLTAATLPVVAIAALLVWESIVSRFCSFSLLGLYLVGLAQAQQAVQESAGALRDDVLEWVDALDAPTIAARKAAEQALIDAGPDALEFLPEVTDEFSAEAATRLQRVRDKLTAMRTENESEAITVHLHEASTVGEALEAISRDSGIEFDFAGETNQPFTPIALPLSFWHAVDLVLDHAELDINYHAGDRETLALVPREKERISRVDSAAYAGVYRIEPVSVTARRVMRQPNLNSLNVSIEIAWEPRMTPIGLTIPIAELSGRFDDGQKVSPQASGEYIDIGSASEVCFSQFYLPLLLPDSGAKSIASLQGKIQALLPGDREKFEIPLAGGAREKTIDAMTVRVDDVRKNGTLHEIRLRVDLKNASRSLESHRQWIFDNPVHVRLANGTQAEYLGMEVYRQTLEGVGVSYLFDIGDDPSTATLVYESPTAVAENEVEFLIEGILLP